VATNPDVLICESLEKSFGTRKAVDNVTFRISLGECYGLLGPNGAGKTTTISIACGLLEPDSGSVEICGEKLFYHSTAPKMHIGYVPQEIALYSELSTSKNLEFFGHLYGLSGSHLHKRVKEVLEIVGLQDRANERISNFSGGMKRRANIAAGLLHNPRLLVLDEPTVGVDPQSRNAILESVEALRNEGMAILYTTHYMEEAARLCDRVGIIDAGKIIAEGTQKELVSKISSGDTVKVDVGEDVQKAVKILNSLPGITKVTEANGELLVGYESSKNGIVKQIVSELDGFGVEVRSVYVIEPNLEDVFLSLTGKELRD
jgi:ABC-2 type transport system ATP-binding protein